MSKEEEVPTRVTRGALRRMSVDQEPTSTPGTPKKMTTTTTTAKKSAVLDAIQEGSTGPSDVEDDSAVRSTTKGKKDTSLVGNKSLLKTELKLPVRSRAASLTEENVSLLETVGDTRRTPRRRPSQDTTLTPQTVPAATKRKTRRNSATSDDGSMPATTPKTSKSRLSIAPPTIAEDDEKEDKVAANSSSAAIAEAELSDLDIRKLRNRAISNSPVPRSSPSGKNTSMGSHRGEEGEPDTSKVSSPAKEEAPEPKGSESVLEVLSVSDGSIGKTPPKSEEGSKDAVLSPVGSVKRQLKDVTFEEGTPKQLEKTVYPKTPIVSPGEKRRKLSEKDAAAEADKSLPATPEVIDATVQESPQKTDQKIATPKIASPTKSVSGTPIKSMSGTPKKSTPGTPTKSTSGTPTKSTSGTPTKSTSGTPIKSTSGTPKKADQSLDKSIDMSLANIVDDVRENINQVDQSSMSILGTPKPTGLQKSHFSHLREGTFSTPIAKLLEVDEENAPVDSPPASRSWSQAVKGTSSDKGIDVFSVRKQEEEQRQEEETKQLNESLKRKSLEKKVEVVDEEDEDEEEEDDDEDALKGNSFIDDEAMEVDGYQSGDSLDSETREELNANELDEGESLGSKDSEMDEEEEENDSFIASDDDEFDLLDGSGDDLDSEQEEDKGKGKKKHKRIIQQVDSSDEEQSVINLDETTASENKSPKKTPKKADLDKSKSPKKSPANVTPEATSSSKSPKKTPAKSTPETTPSSKSPKKTPVKNTPETTPSSKSPAKDQKTPAKSALQEESATPKSQKKTPSKNSLEAETAQVNSADKHSTKTTENDASADNSDTPKSRKSLPAPALLVSADFYASAKKTAKRNSINDQDSDDPAEQATEPTPTKSTNLVTNPAALALAKKNKRLSLGASPAEAASKKDKRASLPGNLPADQEIESPLKRKKKTDAIPEEDGTSLDPEEPMEVDEYEEAEVAEESPVKKTPAKLAKKKKPKDLSEFDTSAILARCNEIVRSDKEKRKQGATLKQKKKDDKRRQREEEQQEEAAEANESTELQKKKKKKKKKPVNYLLEELGEKKEDQVAKALQRKMAILEAKRERKKAKKAAKLQQQLNKENQQEEGEKKEGIGAKFEKKAKKDKKAKKERKATVEEVPKPVVKRAISAFAMYSAQIEELKKEQADKRKPKSKQLKEKNQQPSAMEEVQQALRAKGETKSKKDKQSKAPSEAVPASDESHKEDGEKGDVEKEVSPEKPTKKKAKTSSNGPESTSTSPSKTVPKSDEKLKEDKSKEVASEIPTKLAKKKDKPSANELSESLNKKKKSDRVDFLFAPLKSVVSTNDDELATLKKSLMEPVTKVVKKQKLSQNDSNPVTVAAAETTPPRKLKALSRLEPGFHEEPVTPDHKLLKRNHGFREEPVTPKTIGFKVSNLLPAGQEALQQQAVLGKKNKTYSNSNRIRPEDVKEPVKGLPQPIWTRSGSFEVEELSEAKSKKSKATRSVESDFVPLDVNGGGGQCSTDFLVKSLGSKKKEHLVAGGSSKAHRIDLATVDESVINFKKQAIFGKNAHLREKKSKH